MELFSHSLDLSRLVYLIGAVIAVLYKRKTGITPGGIIVPAYLAFLLDESLVWFISSIAITLLTFLIFKYALANRALSKHWAVFSNIAISTSIVLLLKFVVFKNSNVSDLFMFGFSVPGLIAANATRYGLAKVSFGALLVTAFTVLSGYILALTIPYGISTKLSTQLGAYDHLVIHRPLVLLPLSLLCAAYITYQYGLRPGGFVLACFVAALLPGSPLQFLLFLLGTVAGYFLVSLIIKHSLTMGLERFVLCMFISTLFVTISDLLAVRFGLQSYLVSSMALVVAMGVIINDLCLQMKKINASVAVATPIILLAAAGWVIK